MYNTYTFLEFVATEFNLNLEFVQHFNWFTNSYSLYYVSKHKITLVV